MMRPPRDIVLRAGLYVAVALSGVAAAYALKEWLPHLWEAQHPARALPDSTDDKTSRPSPQQDRSPKTDPSTHARLAGELPRPVTDPSQTLPAPGPSTDARIPTSQTSMLPPLHTNSLPPLLPSGHALLSRSSVSINADTMPSPTVSTVSFHTSSAEDDVEEGGASQTNTSDTLAESFVDVLSPPLTHVISRRRSVRAHDIFAESHISFAELGSLVAPQNHEAPE